MTCLGFRVEGQPVAGISLADEPLLVFLRPVGQQHGSRLFCPLHPDVAFCRGQAAGQHLGDARIKFAQQGRLPAVPHLGGHGPHIRHRQHQQQAQPFGRLDGVGQIQDRLGIVDVAFERRGAQQQMVQHQPRDGLGFLRGHPKRRPHRQRQFGPQFGVVATAALADVVHQHRQVQRPARLHLLDQIGRDRRDLRQFPALHHVQDTDRFDRVLIDGEDMVGVELHLPDDAGPVGHETAEKPGLVHDAQPFGAVWVVAGGVDTTDPLSLRFLAAEQVHELIGCLGIAAQTDRAPLVLDQGAQRQRMQFQVPVARHAQDAQHLDRLDVEPPTGQRQQLAFRQHEAGGDQRLVGLGLDRRWPQCGPQDGGFQDAGQTGNLARVQEEMAHETLHPVLAAAPCVAHPGTDHRLQIERQPLFGTPRHVMQVEPDGPQELPRASSMAGFLVGQDTAETGQFAHGLRVEHIASDPVQGLQVAQSAAAFLDIGLHHEGAVPVAAMADRAFGLFRGDVVGGPGLLAGGAEAAVEFREQV